MSTKRLEHLKEWDKIYLEVTKADCEQDIHPYYKFNDGYGDKMLNVNTYNSVSYTLEDLKQLANDGMPKQGDDVQVKYIEDEWKRSDWIDAKFIAFYKWNIVTQTEDWLMWTVFWRLKPQKTELTLAEVEEKLGLDAWSLIIKQLYETI